MVNRQNPKSFPQRKIIFVAVGWCHVAPIAANVAVKCRQNIICREGFEGCGGDYELPGVELHFAGNGHVFIELAPNFRSGYVFHPKLKTTAAKNGQRRRERMNGERGASATECQSLGACVARSYGVKSGRRDEK